MNIKYRSIEFFGVSGSGKSFLRKKIKKNLEIKGYKVFDTREIIISFIGKYVLLSISQKISLLLFKLLLLINIKTTLWNRSLNHICNIYKSDNLKKFHYYKKKINFLYKENIKVSKSTTRIWLDELILALILFQKIKKDNANIIYFPDEGFLQRLMLLVFFEEKAELKLIKKYLKNKIFCDKIVHVYAPQKNIYEINERRRLNKDRWSMDKKSIKKMINLNEKIKKIISFKYVNYKNDRIKNFENSNFSKFF